MDQARTFDNTRLKVAGYYGFGNHLCVAQVLAQEAGEPLTSEPPDWDRITDKPQHVDESLLNVLWSVNDSICQSLSYLPDGLLCKSCSAKVLQLGHRTVNSALAGKGLTQEEIDAVRRAVGPFSHPGIVGDELLTAGHAAVDRFQQAAIPALERVIAAKLAEEIAPGLDMALSMESFFAHGMRALYPGGSPTTRANRYLAAVDVLASNGEADRPDDGSDSHRA